MTNDTSDIELAPCERCEAIGKLLYYGDDGALSCLACLTAGEYNGGQGVLQRVAASGRGDKLLRKALRERKPKSKKRQRGTKNVNRL